MKIKNLALLFASIGTIGACTRFGQDSSNQTPDAVSQKTGAQPAGGNMGSTTNDASGSANDHGVTTSSGMTTKAGSSGGAMNGASGGVGAMATGAQPLPSPTP